MLTTWNGFIEFLLANDCELVDETDWGFPIYRSSVGGYAGLDMSQNLDDFMICAICDSLKIDPPEHHNGVHPIVQDIKKGFKDMGKQT